MNRLHDQSAQRQQQIAALERQLAAVQVAGDTLSEELAAAESQKQQFQQQVSDAQQDCARLEVMP